MALGGSQRPQKKMFYGCNSSVMFYKGAADSVAYIAWSKPTVKNALAMWCIAFLVPPSVVVSLCCA